MGRVAVVLRLGPTENLLVASQKLKLVVPSSEGESETKFFDFAPDVSETPEIILPSPASISASLTYISPFGVPSDSAEHVFETIVFDKPPTPPAPAVVSMTIVE